MTSTTAAVASMTTTTLRRRSTGFLDTTLADLRREAAKARTEAAYRPIHTQIERVRAVLNTKGA